MNDILVLLVELNIAAAAAIGLILLLRRPTTNLFGPHAAYALWSIVPVAMLATLLPERTTETLVTDFLVGGVPASHATIGAATAASWIPLAAAIVWMVGAVLLAILFALRQREFLRDADIGLAGPAIVGFRHPRIVTPDDFAHRFSDHERKLILTHEQVHLDRNDARINAFAAALRCLFWFNPLVHVGAKAMRVDQELSCDAEVIDRRPRVRRAYAETLLKTHLASRVLPVGCYWPAQAQHPLAERIDLIARKPLSSRRRAVATGLVLILTASAGVAAWAAQPARTIFRETADVLIPFELIPRNGEVSTTRPRLLPASFAAPSLPRQWRGQSEVVLEMCLSVTGKPDQVVLVKSSGDPNVDQATLLSMLRARYEPATRNGAPVAVCEHQVTMQFSDPP